MTAFVRCSLLLLAFAFISTAQSWDRDQLGNHRAVVEVTTPGAKAARVRIPWQRRDDAPEAKSLVVVDAQTGRPIANVLRSMMSAEAGDLVFEPASGAGIYYVYYLPYRMSGRVNYPKVEYPEWKDAADPAWATAARTVTVDAKFARFEAAEEFDQFLATERTAGSTDIAALLARFPERRYFVFAEDRSLPIRMTRAVPQDWMERGPEAAFRRTAAPGEFYTFQLGVWAAKTALAEVHVSFGTPGFRCFNQEGVDWQSRAFTKKISVARGAVQAIWCGVTAPRGGIDTTITVSAANEPSVKIPFHLDVTGEPLRNAGDDDPARLTRLRWLDSTLAVDDGLVAPYTPVRVDGRKIGVLGRDVVLGPSGFPEAIRSYFDIEMTHLSAKPRELLAGPLKLTARAAGGADMRWSGKGVRFTKKAQGVAAWTSVLTAGALTASIQGSAEFEGNLEFSVALKAASDIELEDVVLAIPLRADVVRYAMGLGMKGGRAPATFDWKWKVENNQDSAWLGDVNAGVQFSLHDDRYSRPLNTNFYLSKPLVMPASWWNNGRGGCRFRTEGSTYLVECFSGARKMKAGEVQHYDFRLLPTPFHTIDTEAQWKTRYYHSYKPLDEIAAAGANTVNVHHATDINPYINYPFLRPAEMKSYIDQAHARGMKVKIYYTVRELTNRAPELFALKSLGDEVLAHGPGGGPAWLQEHLDGDYIEGWYVPALRDAALVTTGISRWHNFYIEGLRWLVENVGIDGLYLDDVAFDRTTMKRIRKVLLRGRPGALIDLHSANQYNPRDGFANSANLYLEHFPFIDRLWFGEYFDYNSQPDFWLTEVSGIPFGLMGEMLQDGGNPWRGMVFGMTSRLPWAGDPRAIWKFEDAAGFAGSRMIGWWVPANPVKTGREDVLATVYQGKKSSVIAMASWANEIVTVTPAIDWKALRMDPARAEIRAVAIENFQAARVFRPEEAIPVEPGKGWMLIVAEKR